jgi:hypothetical protein
VAEKKSTRIEMGNRTYNINLQKKLYYGRIDIQTIIPIDYNANGSNK